MSDFASNPTRHLSIAGVGRIVGELSPFGSLSIQVKSVVGLQFVIQGSNDEGPQKPNWSPVPYSVTNANGDNGGLPGDVITPVAADTVHAVFGNFKYYGINVTAGTGEISLTLGDGVKLI